MKLTYLNIANQAAEAEREGDYSKAAQLWEQAKHLTKSDAIRQWAEYRVEHNTLRNSFNERAEKYRIEKEERRQKKAEKALLKNKLNCWKPILIKLRRWAVSKFENYMSLGKPLEDRKLYRRAAEQYNKAFYIAKPPINGALSDQQKISSQATDRCLSKAKIKVTESYL